MSLQDAIDFGYSICNNNYIGYSQNRTWSGDVTTTTLCGTDCSAFVGWCLQHGNLIPSTINVNNSVSTGNLRSLCLSNGATDVTSSVNFTTCAGMQTGDILLRDTGTWAYQHVEFYIDGKQRMGAHSSRGVYAEQVSVKSYYNDSWDVCLRFSGGATHQHYVWTQKGNYTGTVVNNDYHLTDAQKLANAHCAYSVLHNMGWNDIAISAVLGVWYNEGTMNPDCHNFSPGSSSEGWTNTDGGYGLAQWTPMSKYTSSTFCPTDHQTNAEANGYGQLAMFTTGQVYSNGSMVSQWLYPNARSLTFADFQTGSTSVEDATKDFASFYEGYCYSWSDWETRYGSFASRISDAQNMYDMITSQGWSSEDTGGQVDVLQRFFLIAKQIILR